MHLKLCSVLGLFFLWDKFCSGASMRSQSLGRLFSWGATPVMHTALGEVTQMSVPALLLHPTATIRKQKASTSATLLDISAALTHKPGYKNNCLYTRHFSQHWATAVVYAAGAGRAEGTVLFWHLNNYFFWTLAFDTEALCSVVKSWCHYETWNCTALLLVNFLMQQLKMHHLYSAEHICTTIWHVKK